MKQTSPVSLNNYKNAVAASDIYSQINKDINADPNLNYNITHNILKTATEEHLAPKIVKFKKHRHKKTKWITQGIIKSISFRDKLYKEYRKSPMNTVTRDRLKTNLNTYNKILKSNILLAKRKHYHSIFEKYKHNIKNTWTNIKDLFQQSKVKRDFPNHFLINGEDITDTNNIANKFCEYFTNIGPSLAKNIIMPKNIKVEDFLTSTRNCTFQFYKTDDSSILKIINELPNKTSTGFDDLSMRLIKLIKSEIIPSLTCIFNQSLHTGIFPDKLKIAKVIPIFKKGSLNDISNYRPISLLPSISKNFEKLIFIQLSTYLNEHKCLHDSQYGFRKGHFTELASIELIDRITQDLDKGKIPISIFLDLSKAFDTLDHAILLQKLNHHGIRSVELKLLTNYLQGRTQYVAYDKATSDIYPITTGVPQGSILGPLLLIIYINDICNVSKLFKMIIYADDTTLYSTLDVFGTFTTK